MNLQDRCKRGLGSARQMGRSPRWFSFCKRDFGELLASVGHGSYYSPISSPAQSAVFLGFPVSLNKADQSFVWARFGDRSAGIPL